MSSSTEYLFSLFRSQLFCFFMYLLIFIQDRIFKQKYVMSKVYVTYSHQQDCLLFLEPLKNLTQRDLGNTFSLSQFHFWFLKSQRWNLLGFLKSRVCLVSSIPKDKHTHTHRVYTYIYIKICIYYTMCVCVYILDFWNRRSQHIYIMYVSIWYIYNSCLYMFAFLLFWHLLLYI